MHAGSLQSRRLTSSDGNRTASRAHPLGNIDQFHGLRAAPKVLGLLDTKLLLLGSSPLHRKRHHLVDVVGVEQAQQQSVQPQRNARAARQAMVERGQQTPIGW